MNWLAHDTEAYQRVRHGERLVRVTVAGVRGSAPREVGATMWVSSSMSWGTIGGGQLEYLCVRHAAGRLQQADAQDGGLYLRRYPLGADCGQCCGGVVDVLFEAVTGRTAWFARWMQCVGESRAAAILTRNDNGSFRREVIHADAVAGVDADFATGFERAFGDGEALRLGRSSEDLVLLEPYRSGRFPIVVFGAGHVGSALIDVLKTLDADVRWIDTRANAFPNAVPANVQALKSAAPADEVAALPEKAFYLVMTHSHALDYDICRAVLARGDAEYLGLIGSRTKRRRFLKRFAAEGIDATRLTCPIGVPHIDGKQPAEIAIAVAAEILQQRSRRALPKSVRTLRQRAG